MFCFGYRFIDFKKKKNRPTFFHGCCRCLWCFWCCLERLLPNFIATLCSFLFGFPFPFPIYPMWFGGARPLLFSFYFAILRANKHKTWATKQITKKQHYANWDFSSQINSDLVWTRWILWFIKCHLLFFDYTVAGSLIFFVCFCCCCRCCCIVLRRRGNAIFSSLLVVSLSWENIYLYVRATLRQFLSLVCQCVRCKKQEKNEQTI